jgi:zinc protease
VTGIRFPAGQTRRFSVDSRIPKTLGVVAYPTEDIWDIGRSRRLNVLAEVLSEKMRVSIRETQGAAYSPVAFHRPSRTYTDYGMLWAMAYTRPEDIPGLISTIQSIIARLARTAIPKEELQRAKDPILTGIRDMLRRNNYWLDTVLTGSRTHPDQLEWSKTILSDYTAITAKEISELAAAYLIKDRSAVMIIKPDERP